MSYLFISHSSKNNFHAIAIQDWLVAQGWDELFLDLDPKRGIVAGQRWQKALHDAASRCDAVLFLVSQAWLDSEWCRKEFRLAHRLNKRIIGLLIEDIDIDTLPDELTSTWQLINLATGNDHQLIAAVHPDTGEEQHVHYSKTGLTRLKTGLVKAGLDPMFYQWPPEHDSKRSPYRGMLPLEAEDAGIFFGREAPTNELLAKLRGLRADPPPRFMVVLGASGSGKSSFLRAGVLPRLNRDERNFLTLPIIRPEQSVLWGDNGLLSSLSQMCESLKLKVNRGTIRKSIENNSSELIELLQKISETAKLPALAGETSSHPPTLILTIDQGEELFHSEGSEQSKQFLKLLKQLASHQKLPLILLFTIRSDSYERLQTHQSLEGISQQTFSLAPMPQGAYQAIIEGPANRLKDTDRPLIIEPELTQKLLEDIEKGGNKDALPILAFTLERLYIDYGSDGDLRLDEYEDMGGLQGAINAAVDIALDNAKLDPALPNDEKQIKNLLRRGLIPWLAGIDPDTQSPRRRVAKLSEIPTEARPIINHLIEQRLLSTDTETITKNGKTTVGETTIEPAHETLLRQWGLLKDWLEEDLSTLTTLENVQRASRDWAANNQAKDYLAHNAGRLQDAEGLKQRDDISRFLTQNDWDYLKACRELENQQRDKELTEAKKLAQAQKKVAKRTTMGMIAAFVLTVVAGFLGWQSYKAENKAEIATQDANMKLLDANNNFGLALFERATKHKKTESFNKAIYYLINALNKLYPSLEYKKILTDLLINDFNIINVWSSKVNSLEGHSIISNFAVSHDGSIIATCHVEKQFIILWNTKSGEIDSKIPLPNECYNITFSPNSNTMIVNVVGFGTQLIQPFEQEYRIKNLYSSIKGAQVVFSPNGSKIAILSDGYIDIFDVDNGDNIKSFYNYFKNWVNFVYDPTRPISTLDLKVDFEPSGAAFSPDGNRIAYITNKNNIEIYDFIRDKLFLRIKGEKNTITSLAFSPNGNFIAAGETDETIRLWDITKNKLHAIYSGQKNIINLRFSPDGKMLASTSNDTTIKLWDTITNKEIYTLDYHEDTVMNLSFSSNGELLVSQDRYGKIVLWDLVSGSWKSRFFNKFGKFSFLPNSNNLIMNSYSYVLDIFDLEKEQYGNIINGVTGESAGGVVFSPDGKTVVTSTNNHIILWDVISGKILNKLEQFVSGASNYFSLDGTLLVTEFHSKALDGDVNLVRDVSTGDIIGVLTGSFTSNSLLSENNDSLIIGIDNEIQIVNIKSLESVPLCKIDSKSVRLFNLNSNKVVAVETDRKNGVVNLWNVYSCKKENTIKISFTADSKRYGNIEMSSEGTLLAIPELGPRNKIIIWDIKQNKELSIIEDSLTFKGSKFSPDGSILAVIDSSNIFLDNGEFKQKDERGWGALYLYDTKSGNKKHEVSRFSEEIIPGSFSFSPDGLTFAMVSVDGTLAFWDLSNKKNLYQPEIIYYDYEINKVFYQNNKTILSVNDQNNPGVLEVNLWDVISNKIKKVTTLHRKSFDSHFSFSPDKQTIAISKENYIALFNLPLVETFKILKSQRGQITSLSISNDGLKIAVGYEDKTIEILNVKSGVVESILDGNISSVNLIAFSPDNNTLATKSSKGPLKLWNLSTGIFKREIKIGKFNEGFSFSKDSSLISTGVDNDVKIWEVNSGKLINTFSGHSSKVNFITFSNDNLTLASSSNDKTIKIWNLKNGSLIKTLSGHTKSVTLISFSPDGKKIASCSNDKTVRIWDIKNGRVENTLDEHSKPISFISFLDNGSSLIFSSEDMILRYWVWALDYHMSDDFPLDMPILETLQLSPDEQDVAIIFSDGSIRIWSIESGEYTNVLIGHNHDIIDVTYSPDGLILASSFDDGSIKIWNTKTGQLIHTLEGHSEKVNSISISADSSTLVSGSKDKTIKLWDISNGELIKTFSKHNHSINEVIFSTDGLKIVSSSDMEVFIWTIENNIYQKFSLNENLIKDKSNFNKVLITPDNKLLITINDNGFMIWKINNEKLVLIKSYDNDYTAFGTSNNVKIMGAYLNETDYVLKLITTKKKVISLDLLNIPIDLHTRNNWISEFNKLHNINLNLMEVENKKEKSNLYGIEYENNTPIWTKTHPFHWLTKAENGDSEAMLQLGIINHRDSDNAKAKQWYTKALEAGHPKAQERLDVLALTIEYEKENIDNKEM